MSRPEFKRHLAAMPQVLKAYAYLALLDVHQTLDVSGLTLYSISVHLESVFASVVTDQHPEQQGCILRELTRLVEAGKITSTLQHTLPVLTRDNLRMAHEIVEKGAITGKVVLDLAIRLLVAHPGSANPFLIHPYPLRNGPIHPHPFYAG